MDVPIKMYLYILKDIQKLLMVTKYKLERDWEVLPYNEENREKGSCGGNNQG